MKKIFVNAYKFSVKNWVLGVGFILASLAAESFRICYSVINRISVSFDPKTVGIKEILENRDFVPFSIHLVTIVLNALLFSGLIRLLILKLNSKKIDLHLYFQGIKTYFLRFLIITAALLPLEILHELLEMADETNKIVALHSSLVFILIILETIWIYSSFVLFLDKKIAILDCFRKSVLFVRRHFAETLLILIISGLTVLPFFGVAKLAFSGSSSISVALAHILETTGESFSFFAASVILLMLFTSKKKEIEKDNRLEPSMFTIIDLKALAKSSIVGGCIMAVFAGVFSLSSYIFDKEMVWLIVSVSLLKSISEMMLTGFIFGAFAGAFYQLGVLMRAKWSILTGIVIILSFALITYFLSSFRVAFNSGGGAVVNGLILLGVFSSIQFGIVLRSLSILAAFMFNIKKTKATVINELAAGWLKKIGITLLTGVIVSALMITFTDNWPKSIENYVKLFKTAVKNKKNSWVLLNLRNNYQTAELLDMANGTDEYKRFFALYCLMYEKEPKVIPALIKNLQDKDRDIRLFCIRGLRFNLPPESHELMPYFLELLKDTDPEIRLEAVETIGECKTDPGAVQILISLLHDQDVKIKDSALISLGKLKAVSAVPDILQLTRDIDKNIRRDAYSALKKIGYKELEYILLKDLKEGPNKKEDYNTLVRLLGKFKNMEVLTSLLNSAQSDNSEEQSNAIVTLGNYNDKRILPVFIKALKTGSFNVKWTVLNVIDRSKDKIYVPHLIELLKDSNSEIRCRAVELIKKWGIKDAVIPLKDLYKTEKDESVKKALKEAISTLEK